MGRIDYKMSGQVISRADGFWLFCASVMSPSASEVDGLRQRFRAERATAIPNPPVFARELGMAMAENIAHVDLDLDWVAELQMKAMKQHAHPPLAQRVWVHHGPVAYMDDADDLVFSLTLQFQAVAAFFVKRRSYEWQQEYRFTVSVVGRPVDDELFLPIPSSMRELVEPDPIRTVAVKRPCP